MKHSLNYKGKPNYNSYKKGAIQRNIIFNPLESKFYEVSNDDCFYCGVSDPNGVDRLDGEKGYEENNCVAACKHYNYNKENLSLEDFNIWKNRFVRH